MTDTRADEIVAMLEELHMLACVWHRKAIEDEGNKLLYYPIAVSKKRMQLLKDAMDKAKAIRDKQ